MKHQTQESNKDFWFYLIAYVVVGILVILFIWFITWSILNLVNGYKEELVYRIGVEATEETFIPEETKEIINPEVKQDKVKEYIDNYGGKINDEYLDSLREYCDEETLKLVVAISVAETGMGRETDNYSNFYGYFYGGNRSYDPDYDEMSMVICRGISKYYSDIATNKNRAIKYVGNDNVDMWIQNVNKALTKM